MSRKRDGGRRPPAPSSARSPPSREHSPRPSGASRERAAWPRRRPRSWAWPRRPWPPPRGSTPTRSTSSSARGRTSRRPQGRPPAHVVVAMRNGRLLIAVLFTSLAVAAPAAQADSPYPPLPPATYQTVSRDVFLPMDDGVKIAMTVTQPSLDGQTPAPGKFPVILGMTPYGRDGSCSCPSAATFAPRGIAVAVADVRGTGGSGGNLNENYFSPREQ